MLGTVVNKSNNLPLTLVNFTVNGVVAGKNQSSSTLIYYNYTWSPLVVTQQGNNETGYLAQYAEFDETLYFNLMFSFGNTTMTAGALDNGTLLQSFGHLSMNVTTYTIPGVSVNGTSFTDMIFSVGQVPGTNLELVTYAYIGNEVISGQNYGTITLELVSATRS